MKFQSFSIRSIQQGKWSLTRWLCAPRTSALRDQGGGCKAFYSLALEVRQYHVQHNLLVTHGSLWVETHKYVSINTREAWFIGGQHRVWLPHQAKRFGKLRGCNFQLEWISCTKAEAYKTKSWETAGCHHYQLSGAWAEGTPGPRPIALSSCHRLPHPRSHVDDLKSRNACSFQQPVKTWWTPMKF